ncbi:MAG: MFS transporter [Nanoarchaeota archaeon]
MKMNKSLFWLYCLSASVYFGQGISGLVDLPVFFFMKDKLGLDESRIMFLTSLITLIWCGKPVLGHAIDNWNISKKKWVLFSLIATTILSLLIGWLPIIPIGILIALMALSSSFAAVRDVSVDGIMVVEGKKNNIIGRIQSVQWISITVASILTGFLGGYIADHYSYQVAFNLLIPVYLIIIMILFQYKNVVEVKREKTSILGTMKVLFTDRNLLIVGLFIFLYKLAPAFGTPLTFIMQDNFGWTKTFIGLLDTIGAGVGIIGALLYFKFSKQINMMKWLKVSVWVGAITTLAYLWYNPVTAIIYDVVFNIIGMFVSLLLLDYAARNSKKGFESTSFALLCSASNLASTCDGFLGSWLFPIIGLQWLIVISAVSSFLCLLIIPYLKKDKLC